MATNTIGAAGDFTSIADWSDSIRAIGTLTEDEVGVLIDDANYAWRDANDLDFLSVTVGAFTITLTADPSVRHNGDFGNGARVEASSTASNLYRVVRPFIEYISFINTNAGNNNPVLECRLSTVTGCIGRTTGALATSCFIGVSNGTNFISCRADVTTGTGAGFFASGGTLSAVNCSSINCPVGFDGINTGNIQNFVAYNCGTDYTGTYTGTYSNNAGEDGTTPAGAGNVLITANPFQPDGYTPSAGGQLTGAGVNAGVVTDAAGNLFLDPPSIGAYEVAASGPILSNPDVTDVMSTTATFTFDTDTPSAGTAYAITDEDTTPPDVAEIQAGQNGSGAPADWSANKAVTASPVSFSITGLTVSTQYTAFAEQDDGVGGDGNVSVGVLFTTAPADLAGSVIYDGLTIPPTSILYFEDGSHTGANGAAVMTDSNAAIPAGERVGYIIKNDSDASQADITANTLTTVTGILAGGTNNVWNTGNDYHIEIPISGGDVIHYETTADASGGVYSFDYYIEYVGSGTNSELITVIVDTNIPGPPVPDGPGTIVVDVKGVPTFTPGAISNPGVPITDGTAAPDHIDQGIPYEADGSVAVDDGGITDHYHQGLPFTAVSRLVVAIDGTVSRVESSAPFDVANRLVFGTGVVDHYSAGIPYTATQQIKAAT